MGETVRKQHWCQKHEQTQETQTRKTGRVYESMFLFTCGVYVLIGGQPFAPQFKAKWTRGSASGRATWWTTWQMTLHVTSDIPYQTVRSVKCWAVVRQSVGILVVVGLFWRRVLGAARRLFCSPSERHSQCPVTWTLLLRSGSSRSWRTSKQMVGM